MFQLLLEILFLTMLPKNLMDENIDGILVGVGPGSVCTSREVLGIGIPQITATIGVCCS